MALQCRLLGRSRLQAPFFHYRFYSLDLTHIFLDKNSRQVIDNDFCSGLMQVCCKAGVILITYTRKKAMRHSSPEVTGMSREPSCIMLNASL